MLVHRLTPTAKLPLRSSPGAIGYDLFADLPDSVVILPLCRLLIPTGLSMAIPLGTYGRIAPRSGLAAKMGLDVLAGVIDPDYRGEVKVLLFNTNANLSPIIHPGDRIAQLILEVALTVSIQESVEPLDVTDRGDGGFGSTGV